MVSTTVDPLNFLPNDSSMARAIRKEVLALRAENERLTLADRQWADHVRQLSEDNERLRAALHEHNPQSCKQCSGHPLVSWDS